MMFIQIHMIQNHSPSNLNRDDLGAPKTCYFGGTLRNRISSQCLKRSIRMSPSFQSLLGGVRTRQLARLIAEAAGGSEKSLKKTEKILVKCGIKAKKKKKGEEGSISKSDMIVYTSKEAIAEMGRLLCDNQDMDEAELAEKFADLIAKNTVVPDMALSGRMLETDGLLKKRTTTVEASLQMAHALSTHTARPEVDYFIAADDVPGEDAGAAYLDETMYASACFYKYASINWPQLKKNLQGSGDDHEKLAAHTVAAFLRGAATTVPSGKQNAFAHNNRPEGILIEFSTSPISYANAFANPVSPRGEQGLVQRSIAELASYARDMDIGYGQPTKRFWFSPGLRHALTHRGKDEAGKSIDLDLTDQNVDSLDELIQAVVAEIGFSWDDVRKVTLNNGVQES